MKVIHYTLLPGDIPVFPGGWDMRSWRPNRGWSAPSKAGERVIPRMQDMSRRTLRQTLARRAASLPEGTEGALVLVVREIYDDAVLAGLLHDPGAPRKDYPMPDVEGLPTETS